MIMSIKIKQEILDIIESTKSNSLSLVGFAVDIRYDDDNHWNNLAIDFPGFTVYVFVDSGDDSYGEVQEICLSGELELFKNLPNVNQIMSLISSNLD